MSRTRLGAAAERLADVADHTPETRARSLAAGVQSPTTIQVQINVAVSQHTRMRLKLAADMTGESIRTLARGFILDGLQDLENEINKVPNRRGSE